MERERTVRFRFESDREDGAARGAVVDPLVRCLFLVEVVAQELLKRVVAEGALQSGRNPGAEAFTADQRLSSGFGIEVAVVGSTPADRAAAPSPFLSVQAGQDATGEHVEERLDDVAADHQLGPEIADPGPEEEPGPFDRLGVVPDQETPQLSDGIQV